MVNYDSDTLKFMKEAAEGPLGKPPVATFGATGALPETIPDNPHDVEPTRDPYSRPTAPQSPDATQGTPPGVYPDGGSAAKRILKTVSKIQGGGRPSSIIAKAITSAGLQAVATKQAMSEMKTTMALYNKLNGLYGKTWRDWEPETIVRTIEVDTGENILPLMDVVGALQVILNTNAAQEHWHVFEKVGHAFNMNHVDFDAVQPLDVHECALTLKIMDAIRPQAELEPEICNYVAACAKHAGYVYLPEEWFGNKAQSCLDALGNDSALKSIVQGAWGNEAVKGPDEASTLQLQRLHALKDYLLKAEV